MVKAEIAAFMAFIVTAAAVFNRSTTTNANLTIILIISTLPITTIALTMGLVTWITKIHQTNTSILKFFVVLTMVPMLNFVSFILAVEQKSFLSLAIVSMFILFSFSQSTMSYLLKLLTNVFDKSDWVRISVSFVPRIATIGFYRLNSVTLALISQQLHTTLHSLSAPESSIEVIVR